jgi:hypothetical protein
MDTTAQSMNRQPGWIPIGPFRKDGSLATVAKRWTGAYRQCGPIGRQELGTCLPRRLYLREHGANLKPMALFAPTEQADDLCFPPSELAKPNFSDLLGLFPSRLEERRDIAAGCSETGGEILHLKPWFAGRFQFGRRLCFSPFVDLLGLADFCC